MKLAHVFFFNDTATTEIYTLSLHDALPIWPTADGRRDPSPCQRRARRRAHAEAPGGGRGRSEAVRRCGRTWWRRQDRKSTRLNSSHANISYAVFCLKKKKNGTLLTPLSRST